MVNRSEIARKLIELRKGTPREEVARHVGISVSALRMYECGSRMPRDEIKVALAKYYKTRVEDIFFAT